MTIYTWAGSAMPGAQDGYPGTGQFFFPYGVAVDLSGTVSFADGPLYAAAFNNPRGIAVDANNIVYVADTLNHCIRKIDIPNFSVSTLAGSPTAGFQDDPVAANALFDHPTGVAVDVNGNVYVADSGNNRIRKISQGGVTTLAGSGIAGAQDGPAGSASFQVPTGVALDAYGNLYVADNLNNLIRRIDGTGHVTTVAGDGTGSYRDGLAASAGFSNPSGLAIDTAGILYIADFSNQRIRATQAPLSPP